ncbi:MAG: glycosyltransferase [Opitutales bacterium]
MPSPADSRRGVLVVVPARNEAARLGPALRGYLAEARRHPALAVRFLVVLNGCSDRTQDAVESLRREEPSLCWVRYDAAIGKGGAVLAGFREPSEEPWLAFVDADGATPPADFFRLLERAEGHAVAIAVRDMAARPSGRRIPSLLFNLCARALFLLPFADTQCGAKVFCRHLIDAVLPQMRISGMAFDVELLVRARRIGARIHQEPVAWSDQGGSGVRILRTGAGMLLDLLRLRLGLAGRPVAERLPPAPDARHAD